MEKTWSESMGSLPARRAFVEIEETENGWNVAVFLRAAGGIGYRVHADRAAVFFSKAEMLTWVAEVCGG